VAGARAATKTFREAAAVLDALAGVEVGSETLRTLAEPVAPNWNVSSDAA